MKQEGTLKSLGELRILLLTVIVGPGQYWVATKHHIAGLPLDAYPQRNRWLTKVVPVVRSPHCASARSSLMFCSLVWTSQFACPRHDLHAVACPRG